MATGKVKWFDPEKGFGFIAQDNGEDLFVHHTEVSEQISEGQEVNFEIGEGRKGPCAVNVRTA